MTRGQELRLLSIVNDLVKYGGPLGPNALNTTIALIEEVSNAPATDSAVGCCSSEPPVAEVADGPKIVRKPTADETQTETAPSKEPVQSEGALYVTVAVPNSVVIGDAVDRFSKLYGQRVVHKCRSDDSYTWHVTVKLEPGDMPSHQMKEFRRATREAVFDAMFYGYPVVAVSTKWDRPQIERSAQRVEEMIEDVRRNPAIALDLLNERAGLLDRYEALFQRAEWALKEDKWATVREVVQIGRGLCRTK